MVFFSLSFMAHVTGDSKANAATRDLRRGWGGHHGGGGHRGDHHGGGGHHGGGRHDHHGGKHNHTHGNMTEWLNKTCTSNNITCTELDEDFLANCTYHKHHYHESSEDTDRKLFVFEEESEELTEDQDDDLMELYDMFEDGDILDEEEKEEEEEEEEEEEDFSQTELILSEHLGVAGQDERDLHKKRRHNGGSGGGGPRPKSGKKWGNLTDAELEAMKLKRLTCTCCRNNTIS